MKNEIKFKEYLSALSEIHDRQISPMLASVYWKTLEPFSDDECEKAFNQIIKTSRFFPKPADLLEILNGKTQDVASMAWIKVVKAIRSVGNYDSVEFDDRVIHDVLEFMGGWRKAGEWLESELVWKQKEFERLYAIMQVSSKKAISHLPGIIEIQNSNNGQEYKHTIIKIGFGDNRPVPKVKAVT